MSQNPYESPKSVGLLRQTLVLPAWFMGLVVFGMSLVLGIWATRNHAVSVTAHLPAAEVYEAIQRDMQAFEITMIGWFASFFVAVKLGSLAAIATDFWSRRPAVQVPRGTP